MSDRYERALVFIPLVLALGAVASVHPRVALHQGLAAGSLASTVALYDMLFRNPPVDPTLADATATAAVGVGWATTLLLAL
jgi:ABC-type Fe3+-siderophore transport system permease subunit